MEQSELVTERIEQARCSLESLVSTLPIEHRAEAWICIAVLYVAARDKLLVSDPRPKDRSG